MTDDDAELVALIDNELDENRKSALLARLETDAGQITELKNRSLDQLLTLVAGELEDLLE